MKKICGVCKREMIKVGSLIYEGYHKEDGKDEIVTMWRCKCHDKILLDGETISGISIESYPPI